MEDEVLFQIKKEHLETGLRGFPVGYCTTSTVHPEKGLFYNDVAVQDLAYKTPEEVIYFLYYGKQGSKEEIADFSTLLKERAKVHPDVIKHIRLLPKAGHPMKLFPAALLILGMYEGKNHYEEDCLNLIAKIPEVTAAVINHHANWRDDYQSAPELGYMENFTQMLQMPGGTPKDLPEVMRLFNILHYDHGGGNLSTFVGKAVASGLEDLYGSMAAAMNALAGPRHGKANQECLEFVNKIIHEVGENPDEKNVEDYIRALLSKGELVYGFGHAVLRVEDPRATVQYEFAKKHFPNHPLVKVASLLRTAGSKVLKENPKISDPYVNVDAISGTLLTAAGFPYSDYYTVLFGLSRTVGIAIQIVYERLQARGGKGTPIVRPKYLFKARS